MEISRKNSRLTSQNYFVKLKKLKKINLRFLFSSLGYHRMKNLEKKLKKRTFEFLSIGRALDNRAKQLIKRIDLKNRGGINYFLVTHNKSKKESTRVQGK
jgi:hypothetical protein